MGRKSAIVRGPEQVRDTIDRLIRQGRLTLDEIRNYVATHHGSDAVPSKSSLHRYTQQRRTLIDKMRAIDVAARAVVEELGESPDDRAGALLVQSITTVATDVALRAQDSDETSIEDARKLARMAHDLSRANRVIRQDRQLIERLALERRQREQSAELDKIAAEQGMSDEQVQFWRHRFLGIRP